MPIDLQYFASSDGGMPLLAELEGIFPWTFAELLVSNASLALGKLSSSSSIPEEIKGDTFLSTERRHSCLRNNVHVFETYLDTPASTQVYYLSFAWDGIKGVVLTVGNRSRLPRIHRMSNFPYLEVALQRVAREYSQPHKFEWSLGTN
jgi:hypothetical protein